MELVILGFLMMRQLSQYEMKKALNRNLSPYYSPSLGSIQSALKKLLGNGHIVCECGVDNGRKKNIYGITKDGEVYFKSLMKAEFTDRKFDSDSGTRLFFLGLLSKKEGYLVIKKTIDFLDDKLRLFELEKSEAQEKSFDQKDLGIVNYQLKSLEYGYYQYQGARMFFASQLEELEEYYD